MTKKCVKCGYVRQPIDTESEITCPQCGVIYEKAERAMQAVVAGVRVQAQAKSTANAPQGMKEKEKQRLQSSWQGGTERTIMPAPDFARNAGILGTLLLFVGVWSPILRLPVVGDLNYLRIGQGDGTIILALAGLSLLIIFRGKVQQLFWTASASLAVILFTIGNILWKIHELKKLNQEMEEALKGNPFGGLAKGLSNMVVDAVQIQWGWGALFAGIASLYIAAFAHKKQIQSFSELISAPQSVDEHFAGNLPIESRRIRLSHAPSKLVTVCIGLAIFVMIVYGGYSAYEVKAAKDKAEAKAAAILKKEKDEKAAAILKKEKDEKAAAEVNRAREEAAAREVFIEAQKQAAIAEQKNYIRSQELLEADNRRQDALLQIAESQRQQAAQANLRLQGIEDEESAWKKYYVKTPECKANYTGECANVYMQKKKDFEIYWTNRKR